MTTTATANPVPFFNKLTLVDYTKGGYHGKRTFPPFPLLAIGFEFDEGYGQTRWHGAWFRQSGSREETATGLRMLAEQIESGKGGAVNMNPREGMEVNAEVFSNNTRALDQHLARAPLSQEEVLPLAQESPRAPLPPGVLGKEQLTPEALQKLRGFEVLLTTISEGQTATAASTGAMRQNTFQAVIGRLSPSGRFLEVVMLASDFWIEVSSLLEIEDLTPLSQVTS